MARKIGICAKCVKIRRLTRHHVRPIRFFGKRHNDSVIFLCETCHKEIERIIPKYYKLKKNQYMEILDSWLKGGSPLIITPNRGCENGMYHVRPNSLLHARE